ncbi:hypothetical protein HMI55_000180 [Coelomomyces lativittatus]|nr:hypothetical protein HMI55_000180 [Coelomomyces lativittatus]
MSSSGFELIEEEGIVPYLFHLFHTCPIVSVSGTIFYILRLLCLADSGMDFVNSYQWACHSDSPKRFCVPLNPLTMTLWNHKTCFCQRQKKSHFNTKNPLHKEISLHIGKLSNPVQEHASMKTLTRIHDKHPEQFTELELVSEVHIMLSDLPFHCLARRYIYNLFTFDGITMFTKLSYSDTQYQADIKIEPMDIGKREEYFIERPLMKSRNETKLDNNGDMKPQKITLGFQIQMATQ